LGIQLCDGTNCQNTGEMTYSEYLQDGGGWSPWASDQDAYDPEQFRIGIFAKDGSEGGVRITATDIRFGIQISDSGTSGGKAGSVRYTPWASQGGGWSELAGDTNYYDFDAVRVLVEQRHFAGLVITDIVVGTRASHSSNDESQTDDPVFSNIDGGNELNGGWTEWATGSIVDDLDSIAIYLGVETIAMAFSHSSTEDFDGVTMDIGWLEYSSCIEGDNPSTYNEEYTMDELLILAQYAVTVKILPSTDIPGINETADFAVTANLCSNPIYALNNGYSMSYSVDESSSPPLVTGTANVGNWIGSDAAIDLMWNGCFHGPTAIGKEPITLEEGCIYWACGNTEGLHIRSDAEDRCWFDWLTTTGHDITVWLGFDFNQELHCVFSDEGTYTVGTGESPSSSPTMTTMAYNYHRVTSDCVVNESNTDIEWYTDQSVEQCISICDMIYECVAFEYVYQGYPGDCGMRWSAELIEDCVGTEGNLDLYVKQDLVTDNYRRVTMGCVSGSNIILYRGQTVEDCKSLCDDNEQCLAFEYGVWYNGSRGGYEPNDCQLQSSTDSYDCDGAEVNLDLYIKIVEDGVNSLVAGTALLVATLCALCF